MPNEKMNEKLKIMCGMSQMDENILREGNHLGQVFRIVKVVAGYVENESKRKKKCFLRFIFSENI